jgi:hypothetical protein
MPAHVTGNHLICPISIISNQSPCPVWALGAPRPIYRSSWHPWPIAGPQSYGGDHQTGGAGAPLNAKLTRYQRRAAASPCGNSPFPVSLFQYCPPYTMCRPASHVVRRIHRDFPDIPPLSSRVQAAPGQGRYCRRFTTASSVTPAALTSASLLSAESNHACLPTKSAVKSRLTDSVKPRNSEIRNRPCRRARISSHSPFVP